VTHFDDLSAYAYYDDEIIETDGSETPFRPDYRRINVGWLDAPHPFEQGPTPDWLGDALLGIIAGPRINVMRGFHLCTFCPRPADRRMLTVEHHGEQLHLGMSEIRVPSAPGSVFAAPTLVWHYVTAHRYRPPAGFVAAVERYDPGWAVRVGSPPSRNASTSSAARSTASIPGSAAAKTSS
jgi:hypothetical protein